MSIDKIIEKHSANWISENFDNFKVTEIMYCKIDWVIHSLDGSDDLCDLLDILLYMRDFIEDLQELEE